MPKQTNDTPKVMFPGSGVKMCEFIKIIRSSAETNKK